MDKVDMTGSKAQLYNGFLLLFSFFSCRLVYGTYQSVMVFRDIWGAINGHPAASSLHPVAMQFATEVSTVPLWLGAVYLASNLTLNGLNFYWFIMMIKAVRKRFEPSKQPHTEAKVDVSSVASAVSSGPTRAHRRKV